MLRTYMPAVRSKILERQNWRIYHYMNSFVTGALNWQHTSCQIKIWNTSVSMLGLHSKAVEKWLRDKRIHKLEPFDDSIQCEG